MIRNALLVTAVLAQPLLAAAHGELASEPAPVAARPVDPSDEIPRPPPTYRANNVDIIEKLGARVPLDVKFRRYDGNLVTLGEVLDPKSQGGDLGAAAVGLPTIVTFNYSECPMLCNLQLNGLATVIPQIAERKDGALFWPGQQYRIVTISLDPDEDLVRLTEMREKYLSKLPEKLRENARRGWTFLAAEHPGEAASIRRVAQTVGFEYTYVKERAEWAHPASLILLSPKGTVTRYVHGIEFDPGVMRDSILRAGASEPATAIGFMNRCYHFDPDANNSSRMGVLALRIGAASFLVLLLGAFGVMHFVRKRSSQEVKGNRS